MGNKGAVMGVKLGSASSYLFWGGLGNGANTHLDTYDADGKHTATRSGGGGIQLDRKYTVRFHLTFSTVPSKRVLTMSIDGTAVYENVPCPSLTEEARAKLREGAVFIIRADGMGGGGRYYRIDYSTG